MQCAFWERPVAPALPVCRALNTVLYWSQLQLSTALDPALHLNTRSQKAHLHNYKEQHLFLPIVDNFFIYCFFLCVSLTHIIYIVRLIKSRHIFDSKLIFKLQ